ncbi:MAG TPA: hypothetical protein VF482_07735, partial [Trebonia sp.]
VLGLFVVGRLARRHGLSVMLEPTGAQGVTARVSIPPSLHARGASPVPIEASGIPRTVPGKSSMTAQPRRPSRTAEPGVITIPAVPVVAGTFAWFRKPPAAPPAEPLPAKPKQQPEQRGTLSRRVRGAQLPEAALRPTEHHLPELPTPPSPVHDPTATRDAMDVLQDAFARAAATAPGGTPPDDASRDAASRDAASPDGTSPDGDGRLREEKPPAEWPPRQAPTEVFSLGLTRRTPGASLAAEIREAERTGRTGRTESVAPQRDPEAERMAFEGYTAALAKAEEQTNPD